MENRYSKINLKGVVKYPQQGKYFSTREMNGELVIFEKSLPVFQAISKAERDIVKRWMEVRNPKNNAEYCFLQYLKCAMDTVNYEYKITVNWTEQGLMCSPNDWRKMAMKENYEPLEAGIATIEEYVLAYAYDIAMGKKQFSNKIAIVLSGCAFFRIFSMEENIEFIQDPWKAQEGVGALVVH